MTVLIGSLIYSFTLFCHLSLLVVIATNRNLHCPMYFFLITLSINDLIGITATMPRVMSDVLSDNRHITYPACLIQAFCIHMYGGATLLILSIMAFDRYLAICHPLRYHCIMTKSTVLSLIASAWLIDFLLVGPLFVLTLRFPLCKTAIVNIYCDNQSLLKLTCATDTTVNNIYGLFITGLLHGVGSPLLLQSFAGMIYIIVPPSLNPVIYGMKSKEIKAKLLPMFCLAKGAFDGEHESSWALRLVCGYAAPYTAE
ncbi:olfactory receptor 51E2-like [Esox lucius]|uniref:olfactory receptor 51E2-like n=1 Tax=Esox lucius TaxID=8010 RepID=UPI0014772F2D|nr:olfactory receptor 51E2-like [Esox lucius]